LGNRVIELIKWQSNYSITRLPDYSAFRMSDNHPPMERFPSGATARDRFVLERRAPRPQHNPWRYQNLIIEDERTANGEVARVATVFLTGRECPWRCVMCDLWRSTTVTDTPPGAIPAQVAAARRQVARERDPVYRFKLYNAGSFFDLRAVPATDYVDIAAELSGVTQVIVESHPALVGPRLDSFLDALARNGERNGAVPELEVAMGLETVHVGALDKLHKQMSVELFRRAADALAARRVGLRVFLLINPPFVPADRQDEWLARSIDVGFSCGATAISLIPTRSGNGAIDTLAAQGSFQEPRLHDIERSIAIALARQQARGRIFVDLWDLKRFATCSHCFDARRARLHSINLAQSVLPAIECAYCARP
jgi:archaeosine synthase beta-subunit